MSYPIEWMQTSLDLPGGHYPGHDTEPRGTWNQWWTYSPAIPPSFNYTNLFDEWVAWWQGILDYFVCGTLPAAEPVRCRIYVNTPSALHALLPTGPIGNWFIGSGGNAASMLQVQFKGYNLGAQKVRSRKYLGPIGKGSFRDGAYLPIYWGALDQFCNQMIVPWVSQGISFRPVMASRKYHEFFPYDKMEWRSGGIVDGCIPFTCKRRGRLNNPAKPTPSLPIPLP